LNLDLDIETKLLLLILMAVLVSRPMCCNRCRRSLDADAVLLAGCNGCIGCYSKAGISSVQDEIVDGLPLNQSSTRR